MAQTESSKIKHNENTESPNCVDLLEPKKIYNSERVEYLEKIVARDEAYIRLLEQENKRLIEIGTSSENKISDQVNDLKDAVEVMAEEFIKLYHKLGENDIDQNKIEK